MTTFVMYDDVSVPLIPANATVIGVYIDGRFKNDSEIRTKFPHAALVTIAVSAKDDADCLDVEAGDATIAEVYGWLTRQLKRGVVRPVIYTSVSNVDRLMLTMNANKFQRSQYRLWSAHYGAGVHVCGPATCKLTKTACDWTQFTNQANHSSLDESDLGADAPVFTAPRPTPAPAKPAAPAVTLAKAEADLNEIEAYLKAHS
jgi:hypothetical protein